MNSSAASKGLLCQFWGSTIGKKIVMAITGAAMVLFVIGHMAGNLKVFGGMDPTSGIYKVDAYAAFLLSIGEGMLGKGGFVWMTRIALLLCVVLHVCAAVGLRIQNVRARPSSYKVASYGSSTIASRTMTYGGLILLTFIIVHILHFTTGHVHFDGFVHGNVYANVYAAFSHWYWVAFYAVAMGALALHLYHGVWSMLQTLGVDTPRWNATLRLTSKAVCMVVAVGFVVVPLAIFLKLLAPPKAEPPSTAFASAVVGDATLNTERALIQEGF